MKIFANFNLTIASIAFIIFAPNFARSDYGSSGDTSVHLCSKIFSGNFSSIYLQSFTYFRHNQLLLFESDQRYSITVPDHLGDQHLWLDSGVSPTRWHDDEFRPLYDSVKHLMPIDRFYSVHSVYVGKLPFFSGGAFKNDHYVALLQSTKTEFRTMHDYYNNDAKEEFAIVFRLPESEQWTIVADHIRASSLPVIRADDIRAYVLQKWGPTQFIIYPLELESGTDLEKIPFQGRKPSPSRYYYMQTVPSSSSSSSSSSSNFINNNNKSSSSSSSGDNKNTNSASAGPGPNQSPHIDHRPINQDKLRLVLVKNKSNKQTSPASASSSDSSSLSPLFSPNTRPPIGYMFGGRLYLFDSERACVMIVTDWKRADLRSSSSDDEKIIKDYTRINIPFERFFKCDGMEYDEAKFAHNAKRCDESIVVHKQKKNNRTKISGGKAWTLVGADIWWWFALIVITVIIGLAICGIVICGCSGFSTTAKINNGSGNDQRSGYSSRRRSRTPRYRSQRQRGRSKTGGNRAKKSGSTTDISKSNSLSTSTPTGAERSKSQAISSGGAGLSGSGSRQDIKIASIKSTSKSRSGSSEIKTIENGSKLGTIDEAGCGSSGGGGGGSGIANETNSQNQKSNLEYQFESASKSNTN